MATKRTLPRAPKPAPASPERASAPKTVAKKPSYRTVKSALAAVRAGNVTDAIDALVVFEEKDGGGAAAALAMISAFRADWDDAVRHAARAFAKPGEIYAGNVWSDLTIVLIRAARATRTFDSAIAAVPKEGQSESATRAYQHVTKTLAAAKSGKERAAVEPPRPDVFAKAVADQAADKKLAKASESARARRRFNIAANCGMWDEAIAVFRERPTALWYEHMIKLAPAMVARGDGDAAWKALHEKLWSWTEVDRAQIAPAELLAPELGEMLTAERALAVLTTPRGTETWNAGYEAGKAEL